MDEAERERERERERVGSMDARVDCEEVANGRDTRCSSLAREKSISRETGVTYKPRTGSGHSAPAHSRIQIGGILNWVNVRIYRVAGISLSKKFAPLRLALRVT